MNYAEIEKRNIELERKEEIHRQVLEVDSLSNIEKLKRFELLTTEREMVLKDIFFEELIYKDWEVRQEDMKDVYIDTEKICGTYHPKYCKKDLYTAVNDLKRPTATITGMIYNPDYYFSNVSREKNEHFLVLAYKKYLDKYYICEDRNHRFIIAKAMGLKDVLVNTVIVYDENKSFKHSLLALEKRGFEYEFIQDEMKVILSGIRVVLEIKLSNCMENSIEECLERFLHLYDELDSSIREKMYKLNMIFKSSYEKKYSHSVDYLQHLVHYNYLKLLGHKREHNLIKNSF